MRWKQVKLFLGGGHGYMKICKVEHAWVTFLKQRETDMDLVLGSLPAGHHKLVVLALALCTHTTTNPVAYGDGPPPLVLVAVQ